MSSFILAPERIATLADYIATLNNAGYDYFGYSIPEELHSELKDCQRGNTDRRTDVKKVFSKLYNLNVKATGSRYDIEVEAAEPMPCYEVIHRPREYSDTPYRVEGSRFVKGYEIIQPWHYEILKLTQCFIYQCEEEATENEPLLKALKELETEQMSHIIRNSVDYIAAPWG